MKYWIFVFSIVLFSCSSQPKDDAVLAPIARVSDSYLGLGALRKVMPDGLSESDSILYTNAFINNWAKQKLLIDKAKLNLTKEQTLAIEKLVSQYRNDMLINKYKEAIVKQELDTIIIKQELMSFYEKNKNDLLLNEPIVQIKYINFDKKNLDLAKIEKMFKSKKSEDIKALQALEMTMNTMNLNDSVWHKISTLYDIIPNFYPELKEKLLKKTKTVQLEDSLTVSLVAVKAIKRKNDVAPLQFEKGTIRQILLHKRKLELLKQIEKDLLEDAIINQKFETYK